MKTKEIYLLAAASMLVVPGWAAWRSTAIDKIAEPQTNASLPTPKTTPATSHRTTDRPIVSETAQKAEIPKARLSEAVKQEMASATAMQDALKAGIPKARLSEAVKQEMASATAKMDTLKAGHRAILKAQRDRKKPEDMAFLKSLGLSDELRDKVYEMLGAKRDIFWDHEEKIKEAIGKGEAYTGFVSALLQKEADIKAAVGTENYAKLKYYEATALERDQTARFKDYLQGRSQPLTEQQEAAVVDAMYQLRKGKVGFSLNSGSISMEDKLAYIDKLKESLGPVLNANDRALLEQHLKEVAGKTMKMLPLF